MNPLLVACTLSPDARKARKENLLSALVGRAREREPLAHGYRLRFSSDGDVLSLITRAIDAERQCCRFFRFSLTVEPDGGPISFDLTGPPGTREFLAALFDE
jgi:hypothetical protein